MAESFCVKKLFWLLAIQWAIAATCAMAMHPNPGHLARRYGGPNPKLYPPAGYDKQQFKYGSFWPMYGPRYQQNYSPSVVSYMGRPTPPAAPTQQKPQQTLNIGSDQPADTDSLFPPVENIPLVFTSGEVAATRPAPPAAVFPQQQQYRPPASVYRPYASHSHISLIRPTHNNILQHFRPPTEISYATASSSQHQHYGNQGFPPSSYGVRPAHPLHHPIRLHPVAPPQYPVHHHQQQQQQQHIFQHSTVAHHAVKLVPSGGVQPNQLPLAHLPPPAPGGLVVVGPFSQPPGHPAPSQISHSNPTGVATCCGDQPWTPVVDYTQPAAGGQEGGDQYQLDATRYVPSTERPGMSLFLPVDDRAPTAGSASQYLPVLLSSNSSSGIQVFPSDVILGNPFATANQSVTQHDSSSIGSDNVAVFLTTGGASTTGPSITISSSAAGNDSVKLQPPSTVAPTTRPSLSSIIINLSHPVPASSDSADTTTTATTSITSSQTRPASAPSTSGSSGTRPARPARPSASTPASVLSDSLFPTLSEPAEDFGVPAEAPADEAGAEGSFVEVLSQLLEEIAGIIEDFPPTSELPGLDSAASNTAADSLGAPSGNIPDFGGLGGDASSGLAGVGGNAAAAGSDAGAAAAGSESAAGGGLGGIDAAAGALSGGAGPAAAGADSLGSGSNPRPVVRVPNALEQTFDVVQSPNAVSGPFSPFVLLPPVNPQMAPPFGQLPQSASDVMLDVFNKAMESNPLDMSLNAGGLVAPDPEPEHGMETVFFQDGSAAPEGEPVAEASSHSHGTQQQFVPVHFEPNQGRQFAAGTVEHFPDQVNIAATGEEHGNPELADAAVAVRHLGVIGSQSVPQFGSGNSVFSTPAPGNEIPAADLSKAESVNLPSTPNRELFTSPPPHDQGGANHFESGGEPSVVAGATHPQPAHDLSAVQHHLPTATETPESATIRDYHAKAVAGEVFSGNNLLDDTTEQTSHLSEATSVGYTELAAGVPDAEGIPSDIREEVRSNINIDLMKTATKSS